MIEEKKIHFISGLPRAGSTLLANILMQNPRFHATATNGISDVLFGVRNQWETLIEFKAHPDDAAKRRVLQGILTSYFADVSEPVIFDKSRAWVSLLGMAETALGYSPKVLVPVRDMRDVLASFEKIWRETSSLRQMPQEANHYFQFQTVEGRCEVWMQPDQAVGLAYNRIRDAVIQGYTKQLLFVEFEALTAKPQETLEGIYAFLEEEVFAHDFDHVVQATHEDDSVHGIPHLHTIRQKVAPVEPRWPDILGHAADPYKDLSFWKQLQKTE